MTITDARVRAVLAAAMMPSAGFALWVGRDKSFSRDELNWIIDTRGSTCAGRSSPTEADVPTSLIVPPDLVPDPWYVGASGAELEICDPVAPPS